MKRGTNINTHEADLRDQVGARRSLHAPPRCSEARLPQRQPAGPAGALEVRYRGAAGAVLRRNHTPGSGASACVVEIGKSGDVGTRDCQTP